MEFISLSSQCPDLKGTAMKSKVTLIVGFACLLLSLTAIGQVQNEGLANGIIAARQKNATLLAQYTWNSRLDIQENGTVQDIRVSLVTMGPGGQPQRTLLTDQQGALPGGPFRKAIEENKRKQLEQYAADVAKLVDQYTLPSAGAVINFLAGAQVQPVTTPDNKSALQVKGNNVISPGDAFSMFVDGRTLQPTSLSISTTYNGDAVTVSATFITMKSGLNHVQFATISVPSKGLVVMVHNYDYVSND
jgi:hypothetical protein